MIDWANIAKKFGGVRAIALTAVVASGLTAAATRFIRVPGTLDDTIQTVKSNTESIKHNTELIEANQRQIADAMESQRRANQELAVIRRVFCIAITRELGAQPAECRVLEEYDRARQ